MEHRVQCGVIIVVVVIIDVFRRVVSPILIKRSEQIVNFSDNCLRHLIKLGHWILSTPDGDLGFLVKGVGLVPETLLDLEAFRQACLFKLVLDVVVDPSAEVGGEIGVVVERDCDVIR